MATSRVDVLILDSDERRISSLARVLTSRGFIVICDDWQGSAPDTVHRLRPEVIVIGSPVPLADVARIGDSSRRAVRPVIIGYSSDDDLADGALFDQWFPQSAEVSIVVDAVAEALHRVREG